MARKAFQMDMSMITQSLGMQAAQRQQSAELMMVKAANDMQQQAVNMLEKGLANAKAMPAPGTGSVVDKSA
ncbi:hypothetical protein [Maritalea porphyrae]|jgi:hypothetical protein|uniref:hypothetical protein n=1 Tax=Maritalea porphyrae TaxID=880732 RepID=UPI0022AFF74D|nr:hypothetical protein [Maritalea porphyrae]MCZ4273967.1 hypothetical protein [Maritalea porphyrae]